MPPKTAAGLPSRPAKRLFPLPSPDYGRHSHISRHIRHRQDHVGDQVQGDQNPDALHG